MSKSVGIIGNGFVGGAIHENFRDKTLTRVYDVNPNRSYHSLEQTLNTDIVFVCLPTPMGDGGKCNLTCIESFFRSVPLHLPALFAIKSTIPIGTTDKLRERRPDLRIVHNPEFLTAANPAEDFRNAHRNIVGGNKMWCKEIRDLYDRHFPHIPTFIVSSKESETIKYFSNSFLAAKVSFFNSLYEMCQRMGMDYENVRAGVVSDKRIGPSHSFVPGSGDTLGFGGYCFPKDINALIHTLKENNIDDSLFSTVWKFNQRVRNEFKNW